jgi:cyclopropane fatty-acyl-phospholipid synthase-like methyltransferase
MNNVITNRFLIWIAKDRFIKRFGNDWSKYKLDQNKSLQENVGFSHTPEVDLAVQKVHEYIDEVEKKFLNSGDKVLDIGCGVGLYLSKFSGKELFGTDINAQFIHACKTTLPKATLYHEDYLKLNFGNIKFDFIYSVSVIEYIPPSEIELFFDKVFSDLNTDGIIAIQYPHALSWRDKYYSDLSYISYLPNKIEDYLKGKFQILLHEHSFDQRKISGIDNKRYGKSGQRNFCNGMMVVAKKIG